MYRTVMFVRKISKNERSVQRPDNTKCFEIVHVGKLTDAPLSAWYQSTVIKLTNLWSGTFESFCEYNGCVKMGNTNIIYISVASCT